MNGNYIRYSPMGTVTEMSGGNILFMCYNATQINGNNQWAIKNTDGPATGGHITPVAAGNTSGQSAAKKAPDIVALDSTHFVVLGATQTQNFVTYSVDSAGQINLLDDSFNTSWYDTVSGVKLDSTHLLLSNTQKDFRVAEVDANYIGSWSAAAFTVDAGSDVRGVRMFVAGEDASYWYVMVNRNYSGAGTACYVLSVDKSTYVIAQVGSTLTGLGVSNGFDMTPITGYTDKFICVYVATTLKARVVEMDSSNEPAFLGAELDLGVASAYLPNIVAVDSTRSIITYNDSALDGYAETVQVNTGTWALTVVSASAFNFEGSYLNDDQSRLVKVDDAHVAMIWGHTSSTDYVNYNTYSVMAVFELDPSTNNVSLAQKINLISYEGSYSALANLDSDTLVSSYLSTNHNANMTAAIHLWDVAAGSVTPTQVVITAAGVDFTAGASTTLEVQVQDAGGIVDLSLIHI